MTVRDYYEVLGVDRDASDSEIKSAFRRIARQLHPDVNDHDPDAEEKFKEAAEAYEVLSDRERRSTYDRFGPDGLRSSGFDPRSASFGSFEDLFSAFFGQGFGSRGPAPGADVAVRERIGFDEVLEGVDREVEFEAVATCEACRGNGAEPGTPITECGACGGTGERRAVASTPFGQIVRATPCQACGGGGRAAESPCPECSGLGRRHARKAWKVRIPPGIEDGQSIRVAGAGHVGEPGAPAGDLYVTVEVADDRFSRDGRDLISLATIDATRAMLGGAIEVETIDGPVEVEIEAGTQPGAELRLRGHGLPALGEGSGRGDHRVIFDVLIPTGLDDGQQELAADLDRSLTDRNRERSGGSFVSRLRRRRRGRA
jgi:molecular chaperone DnaJ